MSMKEAIYYKKLERNKVKCQLCPNYCIINDKMRGICKGRINEGGILYAENYGKVVTASIDPIEKKPLYHYYPTRDILSISTYGCSFLCDFCQNFQLSQNIISSDDIRDKDIIVLAKQKNSFGIAYTYAEPLIWYEYVLDLARLARENNLKNIIITNGYINKEPLDNIIEYIDAVNLDIKSFNNDFYQKHCKGDLYSVLSSAKSFYDHGIHLEITNLLIPGLNDSEKDIENLTDFISRELGKEIPVHFSRYFPHYRMNIEPTPVKNLKRAYKIAKERLDYVYLGNMHGEKKYLNTNCPSCSELLIERAYYSVRIANIKDGKCGKCGYKINAVL